ALDVQWAHAIAPKANIVLIEATTSSYADMMTALTYAATKVSASVISNSWGSVEFSTQATYDAKCKLTAKLCVFSTGDAGNPGSYPPTTPTCSPSAEPRWASRSRSMGRPSWTPRRHGRAPAAA
ncbi:MAG: S8 family serine peptidase, partial [Acidimicrobiia bacterium]|nr:S8 family serine peptidase [Acidimicrobiia bacterium]